MLLPRRIEEVLASVPISLYDKAVAALATAGILHVDEPPREVKGGYVSRKYRSFYARVNEKLSRLQSYYKVLGIEPSTVQGLRLKAGGWEEAFEKLQEEYRDLEREYERGVQRLTAIETKIKEYEALKSVLELVKDVDADVRSATALSFIGYAIGYITGENLVEAVRRSAEKHGVIAAVETPTEEIAVVAVAGDPGRVRKFLASMRQFKWTPISIPEELPGEPSKAYAALVSEIERLQKEADEIVSALRSRKSELDKYYTLVYALREASRLLANTVFTKTMAMFRGFVDKADSRKFRKILDEALNGAFIVLSLGVKRAAKKVPTKIEMPRFLKPFHMIVRMYGEPDADEIVPTIFMAITFPLIFALMFPDMGHGLLVLLFAQWYLRNKDANWRFILSVLGAASMVTGFLAGEFFGSLVAAKVGLLDFWHKLGFETPPLAQATLAVEEHLGQEVVRQLIFNTLSIALWIAAFMLTLGTFLGVVDAFLKGDKIGAVLSKLPVFLFFFSATLPFLVTASASEGGSILNQAIFQKGSGGIIQAITFYGAVVAMLWKLIGEPIGLALEGESFLHGLGESFMGVYEMFLMALGNIPSFLRIMGLGLAHSGLMLGFTELYYAIAGTTMLPAAVAIFLGALVYAFGNLMVAALEAIIAFAHSMRLHFYEYFSKFYSGTGKPFEPVLLPGVEIIIAK
ncbi:MAG: V-type ATP synthase subunit I [Desulfurococcales archaeon]|nr:V-type ATP synthase subunit I [Desulfurococcales archaeon]